MLLRLMEWCLSLMTPKHNTTEHTHTYTHLPHVASPPFGWHHQVGGMTQCKQTATTAHIKLLVPCAQITSMDVPSYNTNTKQPCPPSNTLKLPMWASDQEEVISSLLSFISSFVHVCLYVGTWVQRLQEEVGFSEFPVSWWRSLFPLKTRGYVWVEDTAF